MLCVLVRRVRGLSVTLCAGEKGEGSKCYMCVLERRVRGLSATWYLLPHVPKASANIQLQEKWNAILRVYIVHILMLVFSTVVLQSHIYHILMRSVKLSVPMATFTYI